MRGVCKGLLVGLITGATASQAQVSTQVPAQGVRLGGSAVAAPAWGEGGPGSSPAPAVALGSSAAAEAPLTVAIGGGSQGLLLSTPSARVSVNVGLKTWSTAWSSWVSSPKGTGVALGALRYQTVQAVSSAPQRSVIPFVNLRVDDFFLSTSAMAPTRYSLRDSATPGGFDFPAARREFDINAGYYLLRGLSVYGGVKELRQTYGPDTFKWRGVLLGLNGSAPLSKGWAMYGNMAIGVMRARFPDSQVDVTGRQTFPTSYQLGEFGLAYIPPWLDPYSSPVLLTIGYRAQQARTRGYTLAVTDSADRSIPNTSTSLNDTTQGLVLSVIVNF
jgi:hypothetical protein